MISIFRNYNLFLFATYLLAFSFSLTPFFSSLSLIFFCFLGLFHFKKNNLKQQLLKDVFFISFLFILYSVGVCYTTYPDRGFQLLIRITPVLLVPLLVVFTDLSSNIDYIFFKKTFIKGVILSCTISIIVAIVNAVYNKNIAFLFYFKLGDFLHIHPTYYSLFILTAIHFIATSEEAISKSRTIIYSFLFLFLFLLQSKIALLTLILYLGHMFFKNQKEIKIIAPPLIFLLFIFVIGLNLEGNRFSEIFKNNKKIEIGNFNEDGVSQRRWLWSEAINQLKEKPIYGFGFGSQSKLFRWKVEKKELESGNMHSYSSAAKRISKNNLHNQYIQIFYEFGLIGLLLYLSSILSLLVTAFKRKKVSYLIVLSFFLSFLLTENLLDRQMGVYFYSFILSILYFENEF